jgi:hypothetical protein
MHNIHPGSEHIRTGGQYKGCNVGVTRMYGKLYHVKKSLNSDNQLHLDIRLACIYNTIFILLKGQVNEEYGAVMWALNDLRAFPTMPQIPVEGLSRDAGVRPQCSEDLFNGLWLNRLIHGWHGRHRRRCNWLERCLHWGSFCILW